jgi:dihydrofolate reductase/thymidylate synthase
MSLEGFSGSIGWNGSRCKTSNQHSVEETPREFAMVVASTDVGHGIGSKGALLCRIVPDMNYFKELTSHTEMQGKRNAVIMGRKTYESIPKQFRPLSNRFNIVLSKTPSSIEQMEGIVISKSSLAEALDAAFSEKDIERVFIAGGGEVYKEAIALPECKTIYFTRILSPSFENADTFFPKISSDEFELIVRGEDQEYKGITFRFEQYRRKN